MSEEDEVLVASFAALFDEVEEDAPGVHAKGDGEGGAVPAPALGETGSSASLGFLGF